jgi:hypothetical protein
MTLPRLAAAELIDIIVPRNLGTCSRVRLTAVAARAPENQLARRFSRTEIQKSDTYAYEMVNTPAKKAVRTVGRFLPILLTRYPLPKLPTV